MGGHVGQGPKPHAGCDPAAAGGEQWADLADSTGEGRGSRPNQQASTS
jgi:hypothetical protein